MKIEDYEGDDPELVPLDYQLALDSQSAPNLLAITTAYAEVMKKLRKAGQRRAQGSDWSHQHPISVLYSTQIVFLARGISPMLEGGQITYYDADNYCTTRAGFGHGNAPTVPREEEPAHSESAS